MVTWGSAIRSRGRGACPLTPLNWNPHSLLQISPTPTPLPSTQLALVYTPYVYPPREEERDSKMDGFKLDIFYREAGINRSTGELAAPRLAEHKKLSGLIHLTWAFLHFLIHCVQYYPTKILSPGGSASNLISTSASSYPWTRRIIGLGRTVTRAATKLNTFSENTVFSDQKYTQIHEKLGYFSGWLLSNFK